MKFRLISALLLCLLGLAIGSFCSGADALKTEPVQFPGG